jgi:uncharacterized protein (DUF1015 family)
MRESPRPSTKANTRVPEFLPFRGLRYGPDGVRADGDVSAVTSPPYDVIDDDEREALEQRAPENAVRLILPQDPAPGDPAADRYEAAALTLAAWQQRGVLRTDDAPAFYAYRMHFDGPAGPQITTGVIGTVGLPARSGDGDVLPHERTLPKARSDRLALQQATRANLEPIWGLSLAEGLTAAIGEGAATEVAVDLDGIRHELWPITDPDRIGMIEGLVGGTPIVLADGHHRFETACTYRDQVGDDEARSIMMLVVECADDQLCVQPIHRLVHDFDGPASAVREAVADVFDVEDAGPNTPEGVAALVTSMAEHEAIGFVDEVGLALLRPRPELTPRLAELPEPLAEVDSARFDVGIRPRLGDATLTYRDDAATIAALVGKGAADAGVLLRPVSVDVIRRAAFDRVRMPEKTTFFHPKPRTGMVLRAW